MLVHYLYKLVNKIPPDLTKDPFNSFLTSDFTGIVNKTTIKRLYKATLWILNLEALCLWY